MAVTKKDYYHNLDLVKVNQIMNFRVHNVTTSERTTLGGTLSTGHVGLEVWDTDESRALFWNGSAWVDSTPRIEGAMSYKGAVSDLTTTPSDPAVGDTYRISTAGQITWSGQTISPNDIVAIGDSIVYRGSNVWDVYEGNAQQASTTVSGLARFATNAEAKARTASDLSVTPLALNEVLKDLGIPVAKAFLSQDLTADTALELTHNFNLANKNNFTISVKDSTGSVIDVDVDAIDGNRLTVTSSVALTGVNVFVVGLNQLATLVV